MVRKNDIKFEVIENVCLNGNTCLLRMRPDNPEVLDGVLPGQFVNILTHARGAFLRRPISVCNVDPENNELWLMVKNLGIGSNDLFQAPKGEKYDVLIPLGKGFTIPSTPKKVLLIGGGVGVAPLYYLSKALKDRKIAFSFLAGARSANELLFLDKFGDLCPVYISTDDGTMGEKGLVTTNSVFLGDWDAYYVCGPLPMMKAVAAIARDKNVFCEVSLENRMACGLGACLCCVENTVEGNLCVCTEGPVFNIDKLQW